MTTNMIKVITRGEQFVTDLINEGVTITKPGSLGYLLWGEQASKQSICIKMGKYGELIFKEIIICTPHLKLLQCGVQVIDKKDTKKDIDLCWKDDSTKTIYVRECKANIELDTEKLPATFKKMTEEIKPWIMSKYPGYNIDIGILNWSIYDRSSLTNGLSHIKKCEANGVKVDHAKQFLELVKFQWDQVDYECHFREVGQQLMSMLK
tara:strand:- start:1350 stop:1970 length:621 start_codon:yes stop_codon:yes gene_type:complete